MRAVKGNLAMSYGMDEKTQQWETKQATLAEKRIGLTVAVRDRICSASAKSPGRLTISAARTSVVLVIPRTVRPEPPRNSRRRAVYPCFC
jgi:hypothetical protein